MQQFDVEVQCVAVGWCTFLTVGQRYVLLNINKTVLQYFLYILHIYCLAHY